MKTQKRILALVLATIMLFTTPPISTMAYTVDETAVESLDTPEVFDTGYPLSIGKVVEANDSCDRFGNNIEATITVAKPDGTLEVLTIDTSLDAMTGDTVECVWEGSAAYFLDDSDSSEIYFDYTYEVGNYTIVGNYIHYEIDQTSNQVIRVVLLEEIGSHCPYNSVYSWQAEVYDNNLCYSEENGFYISSDQRGYYVRGLLADIADDFGGMYYEVNADGELETAYYNAYDIPKFANTGNFMLVYRNDEIVAMVVLDMPYFPGKKVLGIITGFATVAGETEKNGMPTYRVKIEMSVDGESQIYYTEDFIAAQLPQTDFDELDLTGLTTERLAYLQLDSNGKVEVESGEIDICYIQYDDLSFGVATNLRGNYATVYNVTSWLNPVSAGWTTDKEGRPVYNENGCDGEIELSYASTLRKCDETEFLTISSKLYDVDDDALFQKVSASEITAGGSIELSDFNNDIYYIFGYTMFGAGEAKNPDNDGALKNVFIFPRLVLYPNAVSADYTAVEEALSKVPTDLTIYTDETALAVTDAVNAVVYDLTADQQAIVDAYAQAIKDAVSKLALKPVGEAIVLTDALVNYRLRCTTAVVDGNLVLTADPAGTSSMKVRLGNLPEGAMVAIVGTNANASMSSGIITVTNPGMKNVEVPMTITSAEGVVTEFVLVADFNNAIRYATYARLSQNGSNITITSGAATAYVLFETRDIDGGYIEVTDVSRTLLGRYTVSGSAVRFYNPVYDNGTVTVNVKNASGEIVEAYSVTAVFSDATEYTPVLASSLRCTYEVEGNNITVTAKAGVSNVYLNFGRYYAEMLSANVNNEVIKKMGARSWRIMAADEPLEFDLVFDASAYGGEAVTRHVTVNF